MPLALITQQVQNRGIKLLCSPVFIIQPCFLFYSPVFLLLPKVKIRPSNVVSPSGICIWITRLNQPEIFIVYTAHALNVYTLTLINPSAANCSCSALGE